MTRSVKILERDPRFNGVWIVRVPGIYGYKGKALPRRMSRLVRPAAQALKRAMDAIYAEGGHLYISDMFRSSVEQQRAHEDWLAGRKTAYSPPSCNSVHEAARAIDIDAFDTGIGHARVRQLLNKHGWTHIVDTLTGPECWHYEFRGPRWEQYKAAHGYRAMARAMKQAIGNVRAQSQAETRAKEIRALQSALNTLLGTRMPLDGVYAERTKDAVRRFQAQHGLQVDGIAGPITKATINGLLGTQL